MSFPSPNGFGIIDNPLVDDAYGFSGGSPPFIIVFFFQLLDGENMLLLDNEIFALLS